jgi:hypothetical protein
MSMIYVKAKPDRRAYYEGRVIPQDKFIPVADTPYIRRLIDHHGDLEVEGGRGGDKPSQQGRRPQAPEQVQRQDAQTAADNRPKKEV